MYLYAYNLFMENSSKLRSRINFNFSLLTFSKNLCFAALVSQSQEPTLNDLRPGQIWLLYLTVMKVDVA